MKFARLDLIRRVDAEIARREQLAVEKTAAAADKAASDRATYVELTADAWAAFAGAIRRAGRAARPVTMDDVPEMLRASGYNDAIKIPRGDRWTPTESSPVTADLHTLRALLASGVDEHVSLAEIERAGFKTATLFRS